MGADHPEEVFDLVDEDKDGLLTMAEIGACCKAMGMDITDEHELRDIVLQMDGDGDMMVSINRHSATLFWCSGTCRTHCTPRYDRILNNI